MSSANTEKWEKKIIDIGPVKVGTKLDIIFKATRPLEIENIKVGCTCTKYHYSNKDNVLLVKYKAGSIPFHLRAVGFYTISKTLSIYYKDGTMDVLSFKVKVTR